MTRMGIIRTEQKAVRNPCPTGICTDPQPIGYILQCIPQKGRIRPLSRKASDFLIVKNGKHINIAFWSCMHDTFASGKNTGKVIISRSHDKLVFHPCQNSLFAVFHKQIIRKNVFCTVVSTRHVVQCLRKHGFYHSLG